jgi:hypothetical protein
MQGFRFGFPKGLLCIIIKPTLDTWQFGLTINNIQYFVFDFSRLPFELSVCDIQRSKAYCVSQAVGLNTNTWQEHLAAWH